MSLSNDIDGAIIYTDGGFRLETREGGWSVHGYTFLEEEPKKGTGNPKVVPTKVGYMFGERVGDKVTPVQYFDLLGGRNDITSSNEAELIAFNEALKFIKAHDFIDSVRIYSDSRYVVMAINGHVEKWAKRGWVTSNGEPVKNRKLWESTKQLYDEVLARGVELIVEWVKGHEGCPGNGKADKLASRGLVLANKKDTEPYAEIREAQGYWKNKSEVPRILQAPRWYFSTSDENYRRGDGVLYYVGVHGTKDKEPDLPGKPYSDNFLAVVHKVQPDPIMELLRRQAIEMDQNRLGTVVLGSLDYMFSPNTLTELNSYGTRFMKSSNRRVDLVDSEGNQILEEVRPAGKSFRMIDHWTELTRILDGLTNGDPQFVTTDITDAIYEAPDPKKGIRKIKAFLTQVVKYLDVNVGFNLARSNEEAKPTEATIRLIMGSDILTRNQLAALAEDIQSVKVVSWRESDKVGRYGTLIELKNGDRGLWARYEANLYYMVK